MPGSLLQANLAQTNPAKPSGSLGALQSKLLRQVSRLCREFDLIEPDDRIMVACSGGKDSWALLHLLRAYRRKVPFSFSLVAMNLDQGQPGFDVAPLREHLVQHEFEFHLEFQDTYSVVKSHTPEGKTYCSRCSRMRRGALHSVADRVGANKIALGHHRDDAIETLLLNQMFAGRLRAMAPILPSPEGGHAIIRPLLWSAEKELATYASHLDVPILPCTLCGTQPDARRQQVKRLLATLEKDNPGLRGSLLAAIGNVEPEHLHDRRLDDGGLGIEKSQPEADNGLVHLRSVHEPRRMP